VHVTRGPGRQVARNLEQRLAERDLSLPVEVISRLEGVVRQTNPLVRIAPREARIKEEKPLGFTRAAAFGECLAEPPVHIP
jgi:hypothetical protein